MKTRLRLFLGNILFWYLLFVLGRILFLCFQWGRTSALTWQELAGTFIHGFRLDLSMASYLSIIPGLLVWISSFGNSRTLRIVYRIYIFLAALLFSSIGVVDANLYSYWGFRLDATPLFYMSNLQAMTASVSLLFWIAGLVITLLLAVGIYKLHLRIFNRQLKLLQLHLPDAAWMTILLAALFLPIRGGVGISSLTISSAYFSEKQFANHAAINPMWNVAFSITESKDISKKYKYFSEEEMLERVEPLYRPWGETIPVLNTDRPDIIIMIVESLTARAMGVTSGMKNITPELDALSHEGILFNGIYASAERTDKGLAAVIAGYPSLPGSSPLKFQKLTENLPFLPAELNKLGYHSSFIYGGTLDFANYRSFLVQAGYSDFISEPDYTREELASKWGAWDHTLFRHFLDATPNGSKGFFKTVLTLTSHEPFEIPIPPLLKGSDTETKFLNSLHYTDQAIGDFVREAKTRDWWKNTLLIIIADHGSQWPGNIGSDNYMRQHIPMIWLGGALAQKDTVIHTLGCQTDLAETLLCQLGVSQPGFMFSRNILSTRPGQYAFYTYNEGFGFIKPNDFLLYNVVSNKFDGFKRSNTLQMQEMTKAYLQLVYSDFFRTGSPKDQSLRKELFLPASVNQK